MANSMFLVGKQYPIIKSAAEDGDSLAREILRIQATGDESMLGEFSKKVEEFFGGIGKMKTVSERAKRDGGYYRSEGKRAEFVDEFRKQCMEMYGHGSEAEMSSYLRKVDEFSKQVSKSIIESTGTPLTEEEISEAVGFFYDNPNFDVTGKIGGRDSIKRGKEILIIIGTAGSGKTFFAKNDPQYSEFVKTAVSIDPDKYRNAYYGYSHGKDEKQSLGGDLFDKFGIDKETGQEKPGHDYRFSAATQSTQKRIIGKFDDQKTLFGREVSEGSNIVYQTLGDNPSKIIGMIDKMVGDYGYKVHLVQNSLEGGVKRLASNSAKRYDGGEGRLVPVEVLMSGFLSAETFLECAKRYRSNPSVTLEMNDVKGNSLKEQSKLKVGSEKIKI